MISIVFFNVLDKNYKVERLGKLNATAVPPKGDRVLIGDQNYTVDRVEWRYAGFDSWNQDERNVFVYLISLS